MLRRNGRVVGDGRHGTHKALITRNFLEHFFMTLTRRLICLSIMGFLSAPAFASEVLMQTPFGEVEIELFDEEAPETVANFLNYVNDGDYTDSFIHRTVPGFVVQGGGFVFSDGQAASVPTDPPVINEPGISNLRGTVAMAKLADDPNSATSQWFFNLSDNSSILDDQNGGFTVFGQVKGNGMAVIDQIAALQRWNLGSPFTELPMIDYTGVGDITEDHLVMIDIQEVNRFQINPGLNDAWYNRDTNGQGFLIVVFPERKTLFIAWFTYDTVRPDDGVTAILGEPGHRWLTAQGSYSGNSAVLDISLSSGGIFDSDSPVPGTTPYGTMTVEFSGCNAGVISYDIPSVGRQGVIDIERVVPDNVALCEALAGD
jgi:cyclophilin family peptidyl-prolyl cis-trans isomerase